MSILSKVTKFILLRRMDGNLTIVYFPGFDVQIRIANNCIDDTFFPAEIGNFHF